LHSFYRWSGGNCETAGRAPQPGVGREGTPASLLVGQGMGQEANSGFLLADVIGFWGGSVAIE